MPSIFRSLFRFILKVFLGLLAAVFAVCLLVVALGLLALGGLRFLLTGRKPAPFVAFRQFSQFRTQAPWSRHQDEAASANRKHGDVVDVEVREIRQER